MYISMYIYVLFLSSILQNSFYFDLHSYCCNNSSSNSCGSCSSGDDDSRSVITLLLGCRLPK